MAARIQDLLIRTGHVGHNHRRALHEGCCQQRPDLRGIPWGQGEAGSAGEVLLHQLKRLRVRVRRAVFARLQPRMGADENDGTVGVVGDREARLPSNRMQPGGDVPQRSKKRTVGRSDSDMVSERRYSGQNAGHRVLADASRGEQSRVDIRGRVPEALREPGGDTVDVGRAEQIRGGTQDGAPRRPVVVVKCPAKLRAESRRDAWFQLQLRRSAERG